MEKLKSEKSIEILNKLIEINNDRIEGYKTASKETDEPDLKTLFNLLAQASQQFKKELGNEVIKLGGKITAATKNTGKLFRALMDIKAKITNNDRETILNSCEAGEDAAVDTYKGILKYNLPDLNTTQKSMISMQFSEIKANHDKIKRLRDIVREQK